MALASLNFIGTCVVFTTRACEREIDGKIDIARQVEWVDGVFLGGRLRNDGCLGSGLWRCEEILS